MIKVGDLVRFKVHHYHKSYGVGVVLKEMNQLLRDKRHWALFNGERILVRLDELELINENR